MEEAGLRVEWILHEKMICATWSLFSEAGGSQETCKIIQTSGHHKEGHLICPI